MDASYLISINSNSSSRRGGPVEGSTHCYLLPQSFRAVASCCDIVDGSYCMGTSINDAPRFLAIFDLPTLSYSLASEFGGYLGPPYLPYIISDVINGRSHFS